MLGPLPLEVLSLIFSYLRVDNRDWFNAMIICKHWLRIGRRTFDLSIHNNRAIRLASARGYTDFVNELLSSDFNEKVDPASSDNYAIRQASEKGHTDVVAALMKDKRVDPSARDSWALKWASCYGRPLVVRELLKDPRVDPGANHNVALRWSAYNGHIDVVLELLKDSRCDPSEDNDYALRWAGAFGYKEIVDALIKDNRVNITYLKPPIGQYSKTPIPVRTHGVDTNLELVSSDSFVASVGADGSSVAPDDDPDVNLSAITSPK